MDLSESSSQILKQNGEKTTHNAEDRKMPSKSENM